MRDQGIHEAVMVDQVIKNLIADKKGNYVDCTFGLGGHASAILKKFKMLSVCSGVAPLNIIPPNAEGFITNSLKANVVFLLVSISMIYPQTAFRALSTREADPVSSNGSRRNRWLKHIEATLLTCVFDTFFEFR